MEQYKILEDLHISSVGLGLFRLDDKTCEEVEVLLETALEEGINFIDLADIYANGKSETLLGEVFKKRPELREKFIIQTKCGIRYNNNKFYDFSKEHIMYSVNTSLQRMNIDCIDILLLHRPDALMDPKEVADTFEQLQKEGKVKHFGVSNMVPYQMELLRRQMKMPLLFNQLQLNPVKANMISNGIFMNMDEEIATDYDRGVMDYCQLNNIKVQAWSLLQLSKKEGTFLDHPDYKELNDVLQKYATKYNVSKTAIIVAWILRHPYKIQPLLGTTRKERIKEMCAGSAIVLTREEWYDIYMAGIKKRLP